nr:probable serine/threonine-protein kinase DDB_G0272254 isoform X2 [Ipomoea batatas]
MECVSCLFNDPMMFGIISNEYISGLNLPRAILQSGDHHPQPRMMMFNNIYDKNLLMLRPPSDEQHLMRVGRRECVSCLFNDPSYPSSLTNLSLSLSWPHHHQMMHYLPRQYIYNRAYPPPPPLRMFSGEDEIFAPPGGSWNIYPKFVAKEINLTPQSSGIGPNYYNGVPIYEKGEEYCSCDLTLGRGSNGKGKEPINVSSMVGSSNTVVVPPSFFSLQLPSGDGGLGFTDDNINDINNVSGKNKRKRQYTHRKTSVYSFPTNVKNLLSTGIFEGVPVKYVSWSRGGSECLRVREACWELKVIPQNDLLFEAIQTASGTPINIKNFKAWKALYESASSSLGPNPMNY